MPVDFEYDIQTLRNFASRHTNPPLFAFYGGEPLIRWEKMKEIIDALPDSKFALQTNGTLVKRIPRKYVRRFHTILLSIDGTRDTTDAYRGEGTYTRVFEGAKYLIESGFEGELIARMTVSVGADIKKEVLHLIGTGMFNVIHWQLNTMWDIPEGNEIEDFERWIEESYNPKLSNLIDWWLERMKEGNLKIIAPFAGVLHSILSNEKVGLRCGAGSDFFAVTTDGRITACPIPPSLVFPILGNIKESEPEELSEQLGLISPCTECSYNNLCGGRCLYTNLTKHWGIEGFNVVCKTTKHLIDELKRIAPEVEKLIETKQIKLEMLKYPRVPNGVEVIP